MFMGYKVITWSMYSVMPKSWNVIFFLSESGANSDNEDEDEEEDGSYLHPSLFASKKSSRLEELMKVSVSLVSCVFMP